MSCWTDTERSTRDGQQVTIGRCSCCPPVAESLTIKEAGSYQLSWSPSEGLKATPVCTCSTDPYTCPQGLALVQAIHDRKTAQGDHLVRNAG